MHYGEPQDRLERICARLSDAFDEDPERIEGDCVIVFIDSDSEQRSGIVSSKIAGDTPEAVTAEAVWRLFRHLKAMFRAMGSDLAFTPIMRQNPENN